MVGKGWVSAAFVLLAASAPSGGAVPLPDPAIPAPADVEAAHDEATGMVWMDWSTPPGLDEDETSYVVYVNGQPVASTDASEASLHASEGPLLLQVASVTDSGQSPPSAPALLVVTSASFPEGGPLHGGIPDDGPPSDFPPQFCGLYNVEPSSQPPASLDEDCLWLILSYILGEAP